MKHLAFSLAVVAMVVAGCQTSKGPKLDIRQPVKSTTVTNQMDAALLVPDRESFRLGPGDVVEIEMPSVRGSKVRTPVGPDGKIFFSLISGVDVWGKTLDEARDLLQERLKAYYKHPGVSISLKEVHSKTVWILGRVGYPGLYPLVGPTTLVEALGRAKGFSVSHYSGSSEELTDLTHSFILREGHMLPVDFGKLMHGDTTQNIYLKPDDLVYLPSALSQEICVLGAVSRGTRLAYTERMSLSTAIARVGGPTSRADLKNVAVVRGSLSSPAIAVVDYRDILLGKTPDIQLEPHDIVYVPDSPYRTIERYANLVVDTFVRTVSANAGGRAGSPAFQPLGSTVPIQ